MQADQVLNCKDMRCPRPIVEMAKMMRRMEAGQVLELLANDPVAKNDVPAWCQKTGNQFLTREDAADHFKFYVRKAS